MDSFTNVTDLKLTTSSLSVAFNTAVKTDKEKRWTDQLWKTA